MSHMGAECNIIIPSIIARLQCQAALARAARAGRRRAKSASKKARFRTFGHSERLYEVEESATFNKSGQTDGGAPVMSTPILAPI